MRKITFSLLTLLLTFTSVWGQSSTGTIRGTVVDDNNEPIYGASVAIPAAGTGAYTNEDGID